MQVTRIFRFTDKLFLEYRWFNDWVANLGETSTHGTFLINLICRLTIFFLTFKLPEVIGMYLLPIISILYPACR